MKKTLNNIIAFGLMLCASFSVVLYVFFGIEQFSEKQEASRNVSEKRSLLTIRLSLKDFNKQADNNEIWYNNQLYDIGSHTVRGDTAFIEVFHDKEEESLVKKITDCFEQDNTYSQDNNIHLTKHRIHIPDDFKILLSPYSPEFSINEQVNYLHPVSIGVSSVIYNTVSTPPPDHA